MSYPGKSSIGCLFVRVWRGLSQDIPTNLLHTSVFLAILKILHYDRVNDFVRDFFPFWRLDYLDLHLACDVL
jgi:hypothetical protein